MQCGQHSFVSRSRINSAALSELPSCSCRRRRASDRLLPIRAAPTTPESCVVSPASSAEDFDRIGVLKAAAYYEDKGHLVYLQSSKRQFAQQESRNWRQNVARDPDGQAAVCLAAYVDDTVQGCLDLLKVPGQPAGSSKAAGCFAYIKNLSVDTRHRRRALGSGLLQAAQQVAAEQWQATHLCARVEPDNQAAKSLYDKHGYKPMDDEVMTDALAARGIEPSSGGQQLLCLDL